MKNYNAVITKADVRFFPELSISQIELTLRYQMGDALFRVPMNECSMFDILNLFSKDSIYDLNGQYCRMSMDENSGRVDSIMNIIYDEMGAIQDNPVA